VKAKLTKRTVEASQPGSRDVYLWDTEVRGFGVKITPPGARIYILKWQKDGAQRWLTLGRHGDLTADEARSKAEAMRGTIAHGGDPAAERDQRKATITIDEIADRYLAEHAEPHKKKSSVEEDRRNLKVHVRPELGRKKITDVTRQDVLKLHHRMRETPGAANRVVALLSKMFALSEEWGLRPERSNPCWKIRKYREHKRERFLSLEEIGRLGAALDQLGRGETAPTRPNLPRTVSKSDYARHRGWSASYLSKLIREAKLHGTAIVGQGRGAKIRSAVADDQLRGISPPTSPEHPTALAAIRMLILTGCRVSEILTLKWEHIDIEHGCLRLPDSKTGPKAVRLGAPALELLSGLPRLKDNPFVFPAARGANRSPERKRRVGDGHFVGLGRIWDRVRDRAELDGVRLHDLRHTYASWAVMGGVNLHMTGVLLGHRQPATTARYAHISDDPLKAAADKVAATLAAALGGAKSAEVADLRQKPAR
jgi:integrase